MMVVITIITKKNLISFEVEMSWNCQKRKSADSKKHHEQHQAVEEKIIPTTTASATNTSILISNLSFCVRSVAHNITILWSLQQLVPFVVATSLCNTTTDAK